MHEGHRGRLLAKIRSGAAMYEHEYLEALLFYACPRKDVNSVAHALLARFGSISGVLSADEGQLASVEGVGENIALYLVCLGRCLSGADGCNSFATLKSTAEFKRFLAARRGEEELFEIYMLDADGRVRRISSFPSVTSGQKFPSRRVIRALSAFRPYGIFAADIRKTCSASPTAADDVYARELMSICRLGGVRFYDFCILSAEEFFSYFVTDRLFAEHYDLKGDE